MISSSVILRIALFFLSALALSANSFSTAFQDTETPIFDGGDWIEGGTSGLKWTDVDAVSGLAFGTESGFNGFDDSTAVLAGSWGGNQTVSATIYSTDQPTSANVFEEVELRLNTTITANIITGYEVNFSCSANAMNFYAQIVRWNGSVGSFSQLTGTDYHCASGDQVSATSHDGTITAYVNGTEIMQVFDDTYTSGSPGMGFFLQGASGVNQNYGFTSFSATDDISQAPEPSTLIFIPGAVLLIYRRWRGREFSA
jgi:hypothetical protein